MGALQGALWSLNCSPNSSVEAWERLGSPFWAVFVWETPVSALKAQASAFLWRNHGWTFTQKSYLSPCTLTGIHPFSPNSRPE